MGAGLLPVSQKLGSSLLRQASERQISSLRWAALRAVFRNPWKPDPPCLSGFLLMTLSWVGSRELAFSKPLKTWSALPVRFSPSWPCHGWDLMCRLPASDLHLEMKRFSLRARVSQNTRHPMLTWVLEAVLHSVVSESLWPRGLQHARLPCPAPFPRVCSLMFIKSMMPSNHLILCCPLLLLPSIFPSIKIFSKESVLCIRWPKYWSFSFSISPSNEVDVILYCSVLTYGPRTFPF